MGTVVTLFLQYLPDLIKAAQSVPTVINYIQQTHAHLQQTEEWTPQQEDEFLRHMDEVTSQPHWQPEQK